MTAVVLLVLVGCGGLVIHRLLTRLPLLTGLCLSIPVTAVVLLPFAGLLPVVSEPASPPDYGSNDYQTSQTCRTCHADHYQTWHDTYHRTMTQNVTEESVLGRFDGEQTTVGGYPARPFRRGERWYMTVIHPEWEEQELQAGRDPRATGDPPTITYRVDRLVGSHHQQVYLSRGPDGAYHTLPLVWLKRQQRWTTRSGSFLSPPRSSFFNKTKLWNNGCVFCHNTRGRPGLRQVGYGGLEVYAWNTRVEELGIACEACHGSGEVHVRLNQNPSRRYWLSVGGRDDPSIVNPAKLPQELSVLTCARCHGKMLAKEEFDRACLVNGDFFQPGEWDYPDRYDTPFHEAGDPFEEEREGAYFWPDGTPRTTALEYQGVLLSPCYQRGEMTCLSCHGMHGTDPNDQLLFGDVSSVPLPERNRACTQCHQTFGQPETLSAHTHHAATSSGSLCFNCHMPFQSYSLLKRVRSHRISTPNVSLTVDTGIPNACNQCHVDQSLAWTNRWMADWFDLPAASPSDGSRPPASMAEDLLSGHALQRALAVEQFGWTETFKLAGSEWRPRLLLEALEDEYAAVRFLAFEALRKFPGFEDFEFDYIATPDTRAAQVADARRRWEDVSSDSAEQKLRGVLGGADDEDVERIIEMLKSHRDPAQIDVLE